MEEYLARSRSGMRGFSRIKISEGFLFFDPLSKQLGQERGAGAVARFIVDAVEEVEFYGPGERGGEADFPLLREVRVEWARHEVILRVVQEWKEFS